MRIFTAAKPVSAMAMAIALATGAVAIGGLTYADPAHAQRKKKDKKEKAQYSDEFIGAYTPLNDAFNAEGADLAALRPQIETLAPLAQSSDEKNAAGGLIYNYGAQTQDQALQLQGMELMLASGKVAFDQIGRFNFIAYQLAGVQKDFAKARNYLQMAINTNFTPDGMNSSDMQVLLAENHFSQNQFREGLPYLSSAIEARKMMRQPVEENWYRRGLTISYNNDITPEVFDFAAAWVQDFGNPTNWRDAINIAIQLNTYQAPETLDLMRLGARVGSLADKQEYIAYVEAADARRLPKEVKDIIEEGYANGIVSRDDIYVADALEIANNRIDADRADLPALETDADAADAPLRTVIAAADAFLSYGEYDKAERFYSKGLTMDGVNRPLALTRLGIAQTEQGKSTEAQSTFEQVQGARAPIAKLWAAYAAEKTDSSNVATIGI